MAYELKWAPLPDHLHGTETLFVSNIFEGLHSDKASDIEELTDFIQLVEAAGFTNFQILSCGYFTNKNLTEAEESDIEAAIDSIVDTYKFSRVVLVGSIKYMLGITSSTVINNVTYRTLEPWYQVVRVPDQVQRDKNLVDYYAEVQKLLVNKKSLPTIPFKMVESKDIPAVLSSLDPNKRYGFDYETCGGFARDWNHKIRGFGLYASLDEAYFFQVGYDHTEEELETIRKWFRQAQSNLWTFNAKYEIKVTWRWLGEFYEFKDANVLTLLEGPKGGLKELAEELLDIEKWNDTIEDLINLFTQLQNFKNNRPDHEFSLRLREGDIKSLLSNQRGSGDYKYEDSLIDVIQDNAENFALLTEEEWSRFMSMEYVDPWEVIPMGTLSTYCMYDCYCTLGLRDLLWDKHAAYFDMFMNQRYLATVLEAYGVVVDGDDLEYLDTWYNGLKLMAFQTLLVTPSFREQLMYYWANNVIEDQLRRCKDDNLIKLIQFLKVECNSDHSFFKSEDGLDVDYFGMGNYSNKIVLEDNVSIDVKSLTPAMATDFGLIWINDLEELNRLIKFRPSLLDTHFDRFVFNGNLCKPILNLDQVYLDKEMHDALFKYFNLQERLDAYNAEYDKDIKEIVDADELTAYFNPNSNHVNTYRVFFNSLWNDETKFAFFLGELHRHSGIPEEEKDEEGELYVLDPDVQDKVIERYGKYQKFFPECFEAYLELDSTSIKIINALFWDFVSYLYPELFEEHGDNFPEYPEPVRILICFALIKRVNKVVKTYIKGKTGQRNLYKFTYLPSKGKVSHASLIKTADHYDDMQEVNDNREQLPYHYEMTDLYFYSELHKCNCKVRIPLDSIITVTLEDGLTSTKVAHELTDADDINEEALLALAEASGKLWKFKYNYIQTEIKAEVTADEDADIAPLLEKEEIED